MVEPEVLQGVIEAVVFQNYDNGYAVLRLGCADGQTVTVVGTIPMPTVGERLVVTGKWGSHASYGKQFEAEFLERLMPQSTSEILQFLSSRVIKGIGPTLAGRIVRHFGGDTLRVMEQEPQRLAEVSGISASKATEIGEVFRLQVGVRQLTEFFTLHHLPAELAVKAYRLYGESTADLISDDPYLLMEDGLDAPFSAVDQFAVELGFGAEDPRRVTAGLLFELRYNVTAGHCFLPEEKLVAATYQLLSVGESAVRTCLDSLLSGKRLYKEVLAGISVIYLPEMYRAECYCANRLTAFAREKYPAPRDRLVEQSANGHGIVYTEMQKSAIAQAASQGLLIVTGGPGTGKTTIVNGILSLFDRMELTCLLTAPTGRAAKRMTEVTGRDAATIHRLLEAGIDPKTGDLFFARDESNPLKADAIIVDEASMVDILLLSSLLQAVPPKTRLILVGDPDQLPPVGPGFPLSDMLRSGCLPFVHLDEIFRQAQESLIIMNAHSVNRGQMPRLRDVNSDFFFLPVHSEEEVSKTIADLCVRRLPQNMGISPEQIQVLSPTKKGASGTMNLNRLLQEDLNPRSPRKNERVYGAFCFREGDRVMQIRNNYDILWEKTDGSAVGTGIFNGDVGLIRQIDNAAEQMTVVFDDRRAVYDFSQLGELEPAYAMTVHKSQGSEYRAVILSVWNGSAYLLNRSVLYTAITRARDLMILVGREETVSTMTQNNKVGRRYTGLKLRLQERGA